MPTITKRINSDGSVSWLAQVRLKGFKPVAKAFPLKKDAQAWAVQLEDELKAQRESADVREDVATLTVAQLSKAFLADPDTQALRYYDDLTRLMAWWVNHYGGERVRELGVVKFRDARAKLHKSRKASTTNRYLSALRSCWNWGRVSGYIPKNNVWPPRLLLKEENTRQRYLADDELAALLKAAKSNPTMRAAIVVSLATGIRQGELLRLTWKDIDLKGKSLRVLIAKNKSPRVVFLPDVAVEALKGLRPGRVVGQNVFLDENGQPANKRWLEWRWKQVRAAAKLTDFRWHDLRHSCASFLAQNGATLLEIGSVLGHKSPSVTARYAHLISGKPVTGHTELDSKLRGEP